MTDRNLGELRDAAGERRQVRDRQVMPRVDGKAVGDRRICGPSEQIDLVGRTLRIVVAAAVGAGIEFHPVCTGLRGERHGFCIAVAVGEERNAHALPFEAADDILQKILLPGEIPAMVGRRLARIVRHQRHLFRLGRLAERQELLRRITFDVEFGLGELVVDQRPQDRQIAEADVTLIRTRMNREPACAGRESYAPETGEIRPGQITAVSQHRDGVQVDGKLGGHRRGSMRAWVLQIVIYGIARKNANDKNTWLHVKS